MTYQEFKDAVVRYAGQRQHALGPCHLAAHHVNVPDNVGSLADKAGAPDRLADLAVADNVSLEQNERLK